jgi:hypothetical protein
MLRLTGRTRGIDKLGDEKKEGRTMENGYVAMRISIEGKVWMDTRTFSGCREETERLTEKINREIPQWAKVNKVTSIEPAFMGLVDELANGARKCL